MKKNKIFQLIDDVHRTDPNKEIVNGKEGSKELFYSDRMSEWLIKFHPEADELQEIGAKCQHLNRWGIVRDSYSRDKKGYYQWRIALYEYQANKAAELMEQCDYSPREIELVKEMVAKNDLKNNANSQLLEDIACLVFIEYYLEDFATDYEEEKLIKIIQRTWNKMSEKAHEFALKIEHSKDVSTVLNKALS
ncbi:MAG: hypothetical protein ACJA0Q_000908 [Saprospiraceae bacterium]|jgi:hypothetical protein